MLADARVVGERLGELGLGEPRARGAEGRQQRLEPAEGGERDALAGIARGGVDAGADPAQEGQAVDRHRQRAAPGMVDPRSGERRIDLEQVAADEGEDVVRVAPRIGLAAAEQDAPVACRPPVIDDEAGIRDGLAAGDQPARHAGADRLGGEDIVLDRHRPRLRRR